MNKIRRSPGAMNVVLSFLVISVFGFVGVAEEISVPDALTSDIISMPEGALDAMQEFVLRADMLFESDPEARLAMLADPHKWMLDTYGIELQSAVFWTVDLTAPAPTEDDPWLFISEYLGEEPLLPQAVVFSGPELAMFVQIPDGVAAPGGYSMSLTQRYLEIIGGRPETEWNSLQTIVLDINSRASAEEKLLFKEETRRALINYNQRMSGGATRLLVMDIPLGVQPEYGAVHFGPIPDGTILAPSALTYIGSTCTITYNALY